MIIKNLTRKSGGGSGQLLRYIFKYILKDEKISVKDSVELERQKYIEAGFNLNYQDAGYLLQESADFLLYTDFKEKYPDNDYAAYIQNYLLNPEYPLPSQQKAVIAVTQPFVLKHNVRSNNISGFIKEFKAVEARRIHTRSNAVEVHHTMISWHGLDRKHVTEEMLRAVMQKYIQLRGKDNLYVCTLHTDRSHAHLHIAMSGTQLDGKSSRISKQQLHDLKISLQEFQKNNYKNLVHSLPDHGKKQRQEIREKNTKIQRNERHTVSNHLLSCLDTIKPQSTTQFFNALADQGYTPYYRSGKLTGLSGNGFKFRFSRLPVDLTKLEVLDKEQKRIESELAQLGAIRAHTTHMRDKELELKDNEHLQELDMIRDPTDTSRYTSRDEPINEVEHDDEEREIEHDTETHSNEDTEQDTDNSEDTDDK